VKSDLRCVIDTGVVVSALLLPRTVPRQAFDAAARGRLLVSEATIGELDDVLRRPKFNAYLSEERRLTFLDSRRLAPDTDLVITDEGNGTCDATWQPRWFSPSC